MQTVLGCLLPFIGTTGGAFAVFFLRRGVHARTQGMLLSVSAGVMLAASIWSLILPSLECASGALPWMPACAGTLMGVAVLLWLDRLTERLRPQEDAGMHRMHMLMLAVTLHNIPEGMAVGAAFAGVMRGEPAAAAFALSLGVALQNIPEGAIISLPLAGAGMRRGKAFLFGTLSGAVEPVAAAVTVGLSTVIGALLPYLLAFAAGAMLCVTVADLIPSSQKDAGRAAATLCATAGFCLMMVLDVTLGNR